MSKGKKQSKKKEDDFDFLGKFTNPQDMDIDLKDPALMKELKEMGWNEEDDMDLDPELMALEKEIEDDEEIALPVSHGKEMTAEEIENAKFDDDDLNDPELLAELEGVHESEDEINSRIEELKKQIEISKQNALKEKQNGNKEKALDHLKLMKSLQVELESSAAILNVHKVAQSKEKKPVKQKAEAPEPYDDDFDYTSIVSMNVLEFEKEKAARNRQSDIVDTIDMQISIISNNIEYGVITQEAYISNLQKKINEYKKIINDGGDKNRYLKHIELMEKELQEASEMEEEEEEEKVIKEEALPVPAAKNPEPQIKSQTPVISHEDLMQNIRYKGIYESFEEGKHAFQYLKDLGKSKLCEKLVVKLEKWQEIIKAFQSGKEPKIDIKEFSPQDVTGMSEEERRNQFKKLIAFSADQAAKCKESALAALRQKDKELAALLKREMVSHEAKSKQLEESMKNPWQISPDIGVKSMIKSAPQLNEDVVPGSLEISYGKGTGFSDKEEYLITYSLIAGDTLTGTTEKISKICEKGVNFTFTIKIDGKNYNGLFKKHVIFEVFEYHRLRSNKSQGTCNIKLEGLAKQCTYKTVIQLSRKGPQIDVTFRVNKSLSVPEFKQVSENHEYIEDLYVPYRNFEGRISQLPASKRMIVEEKKIEEVKGDTNFDDIAQDEYENPNVIRNLISFDVLELEIERLKSIIIDLRSSGKNADRIISFQRELMKNKSTIEAQVGNGLITPEQYKEVLQNQVQHDIKLAQFYKQKGNKEHLTTVVNRVKIMKKEIEELNKSE